MSFIDNITFSQKITGLTVIQLPDFPNAISSVSFTCTAVDESGSYFASKDVVLNFPYTSLTTSTTTSSSSTVFIPFENLQRSDIVNFAIAQASAGNFNLAKINDELRRAVDEQKYFAKTITPIDFPWNQ